jgi:exosortase
VLGQLRRKERFFARSAKLFRTINTWSTRGAIVPLSAALANMVQNVLLPAKPMETVTVVDMRSVPRAGRAGLSLLIKIGAVAVLIAALYFSVMVDLASEWSTDDSASYGMLIPPTALYIAYLRRQVTLGIPAQRDVRGLWLLAAACLVFLTGGLAGEFFLTRISFVLLLAGLTWTFWGVARLKNLAFPLVLLGTMVPLPTLIYNAAAAPLQLLASTIATDLAQALGVSIYRDGNIIYLANASLGVEEACSGLHSLSALIVASLLLGFLERLAIPGRILLFVLSVPLAIVVNVVRVTGTALLADYRLEFAMGFYHSFSGWLVFVVGFGVLWMVAKLLFRLTNRNL